MTLQLLLLGDAPVGQLVERARLAEANGYSGGGGGADGGGPGGAAAVTVRLICCIGIGTLAPP